MLILKISNKAGVNMIDVDALIKISKSQNECNDLGVLDMTFKSDSTRQWKH